MQLGYIYGVGFLHILFHPLIAQDGSWAVKVLGGLEAANDIAERNGFINHGQVEKFKSYTSRAKPGSIYIFVRHPFWKLDWLPRERLSFHAN